MPTESVTKAQVQAYRFGMRRLQAAVTRGEAFQRRTGRPRHGLSVLVGIGLAALVLAGFAVYGLIRPAPTIGNARVVIDSDTGGAYVVRDGVLYPALDLSSAMLAAGYMSAQSGSGDAGSGSAPSVATVDQAAVAKLAKGQLLGIPGAPNEVPTDSELITPSWTVCELTANDPAKAPSAAPTLTTTVVLGTAPVPPSQVGNRALLVTPDGGRSTYLLWNGHRSRLDLGEHAIGLALQVTGLAPRPITVKLLNAVPAAPDIAVPKLSGVGDTVSWDRDLTVGTVFAVHLAAGTDFYVALSDGVQRIDVVAADMIRAAYGSSATIPAVPPATLKAAPQTAHPIDLSDFPADPPQVYGVADAPVICLSWSGAGGDGAYAVYPDTTSRLPAGAKAVPAPPGSPAGAADAVYVAPGHGAVIGQVVGGQSASTGALFLVTDRGVKFPVVSMQALRYLGLGSKINPAPPALVALLPTGPTLDPAQAARFYPGAAPLPSGTAGALSGS